MSQLKEELRLTEAGREYVENVIIPKYTNSLALTNKPDGIKPYIKVDAIRVPEGATNGDVLQLMFPNIEVKPVTLDGKLIGYDISKLDDGSCAETYFTERGGRNDKKRNRQH